jgi:RimJ/RimL family protein N-acetyltransferase
MSTARDARPPKRILRFDCGRYFVRTIKREDASDRWAGWLADPWAAGVMNSPARTLGKRDIADYIRQFDQRSRLLLGVFEKGTRAHVGIIRIDADYVTNECHVNVLIGNPEYRGRGLMSEISVATLHLRGDRDQEADRLHAGAQRADQELSDRSRLAAGWDAPAGEEIGGGRRDARRVLVQPDVRGVAGVEGDQGRQADPAQTGQSGYDLERR